MIIQCEDCLSKYNNETVSICPACGDPRKHSKQRLFKKLSKEERRKAAEKDQIRRHLTNEKKSMSRTVRSYQTYVLKGKPKGMKLEK